MFLSYFDNSISILAFLFIYPLEVQYSLELTNQSLWSVKTNFDSYQQYDKC